MNKEELLINKNDLIDWIDRPPSNDDLDLITFITTRLEKFFDLEQENKTKDKEIERLLNIMRPEKVDYDYFALLFENKPKEEVIKALAYKCEQLQNLYKCYEDKEIEARKKDNIIKEAREYIEENGITEITWGVRKKPNKKELFKDGASLYELLEILDKVEENSNGQ